MMTSLHRIKITWTGMPGGPGVTQLYAPDATTVTAALGTWIDAWKYLVPDNTTLTVPSEGDIIDTATGVITGSWAGSAPTTHVGTGSSGSYVAASGACITWTTGVVVRGRRLKGRTFLVPLSALAYQGSGLIGTAQTAIQNATNTLLASAGSDLNVWSRPTAKGAADGAFGMIEAAVVKNRQAILSSRRP
jgi:hypothetical protein